MALTPRKVDDAPKKKNTRQNRMSLYIPEEDQKMLDALSLKLGYSRSRIVTFLIRNEWYEQFSLNDPALERDFG